MSKLYTIEYRWCGRSFHTVVAGADRRAAAAEFRREFPHVDVMAGGAGRAVKSVCRLVIGGGRKQALVLPINRARDSAVHLKRE